MNEFFRNFANRTSAIVGSAWTFLAAVLLIVGWAVTGPIFNFSDTWQLVINTGTTIITFLMVFLIQNTQNRDAKAIQIKLDELIRGSQGARTALVDLENMSEEDLNNLKTEFEKLRERHANAAPILQDDSEAIDASLKQRDASELEAAERR